MPTASVLERAGSPDCGAGTFEEATTLRPMSDDDASPIHQNNSRMASIASGNFLNALNER